MDPAPAVPFSSPSFDAPQPVHPWYNWRRWGWNFLTISILAHVLFGIVAAYFIVATIQGKRNQFDAPGGKGPNAPTRALEHKVQMARKQNSMSAPVAAKRITTTGLSKVALPSLPTMPKMNALVLPATMTGMGGAGMGLGGFGGGGGGSGGNGGGGLSLFGARTRTGGSLAGHLFDLKQNRSRGPTGINVEKALNVLSQFVRGGFNMGILNSYYEASVPLYATQLFTPNIDAVEAPKAFGVEQEVQPMLWAAVYSGKVVPNETGTFRFVGFGDDLLVVRFNGRVVLDRGYFDVSGVRSSHIYKYDFDAGNWYKDATKTGGHGDGAQIQVEAGKSYDMQVLIAELYGGRSMFQLLIEKDGVDYQQDANNHPIFPLFRLSAGTPLPQPSNAMPPFAKEGPVWGAEIAGAAPKPGL